tara:strand:+ start:15805 stop:16485 length:681 start_codon:yes stop_codon:yes gene_type:complete
VILVLVGGLLVGCTTTRVFIFTEGLEANEAAALNSEILMAGFQVVTNTLPVPEGVARATIMYSPEHRSLKQIEKLRDLLLAIGYPTDLEPFSLGNHHYTGSNVGFYPTPYTGTETTELTIQGRELFGECPVYDATLQLNQDLTFSFDLIGFDEITHQETHDIQAGIWWQTHEAVFLSAAKREYEFRLERIKGRSDYATIDGIRLLQVGPEQLKGRCNFVYQELDPL